MTESVAVARAAARSGPADRVSFAALEPRRKLQLALALVWLLDGILQFQPWMFSQAFPQMLADSAHGNPAVLAAPITWSAGLIGHYPTILNALFATIQVALGLGIACRASVKYALGASVAWSLGVWWFGEGFGGILAGTASPVNGAPGAVILYALLAVLLWPANTTRAAANQAAANRAAANRAAANRAAANQAAANHAAANPGAPFVAGLAIGRRPAQALWLVLWGSLAFFSLTPASRAPQAISGAISDMAAGEPSWLGWIDSHAASALAHQGLAASIVLAAAFAIIAAGIYVSARSVIMAALVITVALWLAQGLGGIFTGMGTDVESAPLLALIALAFWPSATAPEAGWPSATAAGEA
jgi:hypothetical protein